MLVESPRKLSGLPTDKLVAIYYRQSSPQQIGNVSTSWQLLDLPKYLQQLGWLEDSILTISEDGAQSGNLQIENRPGMLRLFQLVLSRKIAAVAVSHEDRLFRDMSQIQVNRFIVACYNSNVIIITPETIYDFCHPTQGQADIRGFRFQAEASGEYIASIVRGRIAYARQWLRLNGCWAGEAVAVGYMVDWRKNRADGLPNPNRGKYVPFEPFCSIVQAYFRIFLENEGHLALAHRHIIAFGPYFPDTRREAIQAMLPEGYRTNQRHIVPKRQGLVYPSVSALAYILTNPVYLGYWVVQDRIVVRNNHTPLVDEDVFMQAFNYLSDVKLDGFRNQSRIKLSPSRLKPTGLSSNACPLVVGMAFDIIDKRELKIVALWDKVNHKFRYRGGRVEYRYNWAMNCELLDRPLEQMLFAKITVTLKSIDVNSILVDAPYTLDLVVRELVDEQQTVAKVVATLEDNLRHSIDPDLRDEILESLEVKKRHIRMLEQKLRRLSQETDLKAYIIAFRRKCISTVADWPRLSLENRKMMLRALIIRIVVTRIASKYQIRIFWRDKTVDQFELPTHGRGPRWSTEEDARLLSLVEAGESQLVICAAFPMRTWEAIMTRLRKSRHGHYEFVTFVANNETYSDFVERTGGNLESIKPPRWQPYEDQLLATLINAGATRVELCHAFPYRTWNSIVQRLHRRCFRVPPNDGSEDLQIVYALPQPERTQLTDLNFVLIALSALSEFGETIASDAFVNTVSDCHD